MVDNNIFDYEDKMSVKEMMDNIIFKCNDYVEQVVKDVYPEFYNFSKEICNKINNSSYAKSFFKEPIYITSINFWNEAKYKKDEDGGQSLIVGDDKLWAMYSYFEDPIKINLAKKWINYQKDNYFPGILIGKTDDSYFDDKMSFKESIDINMYYSFWNNYIHVFSSIPKKIVMSIDEEDVEVDKPISFVSLEYFNMVRESLLDNELFDLYNCCVNNINDNAIKEIEKQKEKIAKVASHKIMLDNGMYIKFELDPKEEFCRSNMTIKIYDKNMDEVFIIDNLDELDYKNKKVKRILDYKIDSHCFKMMFDFELEDIDKKYNKIINEEDRKIKNVRDNKLKKLQVVKKEEEEINDKINKIRKKVSYYLEELKSLNKSTKRLEIPQDVLFDWNEEEKCFEIYKEFKDKLRFIDLAIIDFTNVKVVGLDFRGCNITIFDPQTIYNKDLSSCQFQITEEELKNNCNIYYIPSINWDLSGVNLCGANLYVPLEYIENNFFSMPRNINKSIIDDSTILPELLQPNLTFRDLVDNKKFNKLVECIEKENISIDELLYFSQVLKQQGIGRKNIKRKFK